MHQVRLIAWDLSGVLTEEASYSPIQFADRCSLSRSAWMDIFRSYCDVNRKWDQVEKGILSLDDFARGLAERIENEGGQCSTELARELWGAPDPFTAAMSVRTELLDKIAVLRDRGYRNCLCTNNVAEWRKAWRKLISPIDLFDWVFDSSEIGFRKPEDDFFRAVEKTTAFSKDQILFIDDRKENTLRAEAVFGWKTIHFTGDSDHILERLATKLTGEFECP
jgi:HAD superfamily hydrolase (TIGR01509 family)